MDAESETNREAIAESLNLHSRATCANSPKTALIGRVVSCAMFAVPVRRVITEHLAGRGGLRNPRLVISHSAVTRIRSNNYTTN